jgi:hypothetical protein
MARGAVGIALVAFLIGVGGALIRGFWGVSQDCHAWVNSHGYQLVQNDWWAKHRGFCRRHLAGDGHDRLDQQASWRKGCRRRLTGQPE